MTTFGERLLLERRRRGLTQKALAAAAGLNSNTLARVERGEVKDLAGQSVARLARALGCSSDSLLGLVQEADAAESTTSRRDGEDLCSACNEPVGLGHVPGCVYALR